MGAVDLICTPHITCRQDTTNVNIYIYKYNNDAVSSNLVRKSAQ